MNPVNENRSFLNSKDNLTTLVTIRKYSTVNCRYVEAANMETKKIRIETILDDGTKISVSLQSRPSREKISKFFDLLELMGAGFSQSLEQELEVEHMTLLDRLVYIIKKNLFSKKFTINDIAVELEREFGYSMKRSTLATYLSRLVDQNILERNGSRGHYCYNLVLEQLK